MTTRGTRVDGRMEGQRAEGVDERSASTATSGWRRCGPIRTRRSTPASPRWSSTCTHPVSRCGRCARSPATRTSTRSSSTTCSCPTTTSWGRPNDGWTVARSTLGNERVSIGGGVGGIFPAMDLLALLKSGGDRVPGRIGAHRRHPGQGPRPEGAEPAPGAAGRDRIGPGPEGNVTKLVLAEHGHDRARLQADLVGPRHRVPRRRGGRWPGTPSSRHVPCRSPAGRPRSPATRSPSASSGLPRDPLIR